MIRHSIMPAVLIAMLAGCGGPESDPAPGRKQSAEEVAEAASGIKMRPGQWEMRYEMVGGPELPPQVREAMKAQSTKTRICITPQDVEKPNADMFAGQKAANCSYSDFDFGGGEIKGRITCDSPVGKSTMVMDGDYGADTYQVRTKMTTEGQDALAMEIKVDAKRIGECPAGAAAKG